MIGPRTHDPHPGFQLENFLGKYIDEFLDEETAGKVALLQKTVLETGGAQNGQLSFTLGGQQVYYEYYIDPIQADDGAIIGVACAAYDVTEIKKTEQDLVEVKNHLEQTVIERTRELRQSQTTLETMLNALPEVAALIDREGKIINGNQTLAERFNRPLQMILGTNVYGYFNPEVAAARKAKIESVFSSGKALRYTDTRDGRYYDNMVHPILDENHQVSSVVVVASDVTNWILTQGAIAAGRERLKELARKVVTAQEEERRRISCELHDEAGQALTALGISLNLFLNDLPESRVEERKKLSDAVALVNATMEQIRALAQGLRPQALDALGLNSAIEGYCRDFSRRTRIEIEYKGVEAPSLPDIASVSMYRFLQEALTNAARHAQASRLKVSLSLRGEILTVRVQDNGIGFDAEAAGQGAEAHEAAGIGLIGMRERIEMIGGLMDVASTPGKGTTLTAMIHVKGDPVERRKKNDTSRHRG